MKKPKPLTTAQVISVLRRLERLWPGDLELFVGDGTLELMPHPLPMTDLGRNASVDSGGSLASFPRIKADGGGW